MNIPKELKISNNLKDEKSSSSRKEISSMIEEIFNEKYEIFKDRIDSFMQRVMEDIKEEAEIVSAMYSFSKKTRDRFPNLNNFKWVKIKIDLSIVDLKLIESFNSEEHSKTWIIFFPNYHKYKELTANTVHDLNNAKNLFFYIPLGIKKSQYLFITDEVNQITIS